MGKIKGLKGGCLREVRIFKTNEILQKMTKEQLIAEIKTNNAQIGKLRTNSGNRLGQIRSMRVQLKAVHDKIERILKTPYFGPQSK